MTTHQQHWQQKYEQAEMAMLPYVIEHTQFGAWPSPDTPTHILRYYRNLCQVGVLYGWL